MFFLFIFDIFDFENMCCFLGVRTGGELDDRFLAFAWDLGDAFFPSEVRSWLGYISPKATYCFYTGEEYDRT